MRIPEAPGTEARQRVQFGEIDNVDQEDAQRLAQEDGVSPNQWIAVAGAEKVGVVETAVEFFEKRAGKATGKGLIKFLRHAPSVPPEPEDVIK